MRALLFLFLLLSFAACPPPSIVVDSGAGGGTADSGCDGLIGCACASGACVTGECVSGTCTACQRGEAACLCRGNDTCNAGLRCSAASQCETCPAGAEGCPCNTGNTCDVSLLCAGNTCVPDTCVEGTVGCPCHASGAACDGAAYCDDTQRCQTCSSDVAGCACDGSGACQGGLTCESSTCRLPKSCGDQYDAGTCVPHQMCTQAPGDDALCAAAQCDAEFKWDATSNTCVACVTAGCALEPDCSADGGFAEQCSTQHRACDQTGQVAECGACVPGFALDAMNHCVQVPSCGATTCTINEMCDSTSGTPTCVPLLCSTGQAQTTGGTCQACTLSCMGTGLSGRVWSKRTLTDSCLCETLDGWFMPAGGAVVAVACDADRDGWVREEADDATVRADPAVKANARCQIRSIDRARLVDEYGVSIDVVSCTQGLVVNGAPDGGSSCAALARLRLLETQRNDVPGLAVAPTAPVYGASNGGRLLDASELNPLTKACVSLQADYNDDGQDDISQAQNKAPLSESDRLSSFAYFVELYTAAFEAVESPLSGRLTIRERSRCSPGFPLRYDPSVTDPTQAFDFYSSSSGGTYWRNCARGRDPQYASGSTTPGFDFAQFTCEGTSCAIVPPAHPTLVGPTDPSMTLMRNFGLCELGTAPPADGRWRGFNHHSQFKCVNVTGVPTQPFNRLPADFSTANGKLTFNTCLAGTLLGASDGGVPQTRTPQVLCRTSASVSAGNVGFGAVNYRPYGPYGADAGYLGGCVNEDVQYVSYVCPFPEFSTTNAGLTSFGRYSCFGAGSNFLWCDQPCNAVRATLIYNGGPQNSVLR